MQRVNALRLIAFAAVLSLVGIGSIATQLPSWNHAIFGDEGDGFYCMWVMGHNIQTLTKFDMSGWLDGRIFFPIRDPTILWSENLLFPSIIYGLFQSLGLGSFAAFNTTGLILFFFSYLSVIAFFSAILNTQKDRRTTATILVIIAAFCTTFHVGKYVYFMHFQNLSSFWVIIAATGLIHIFRENERLGIRLLSLGIIGCLYSAMYFAVLAVTLTLVSLPFYLIVHGWKKAFSRLLDNKFTVVALILVSSPILAAYGMVHSQPSQPGDVHFYSGIDFINFFKPFQKSNAFTLAETFLGQLTWTDHEQPGYLGYATIVLIAVMVFNIRNELWLMFRNLMVTKGGGAFLCAVLIASLFRNFKDYLAIPVFISLGWLLMSAYMQISDKVRDGSARAPLAVNLIFLIITYGLALGGSFFFRTNTWNPSVWGLLAKTIPGVTKMRAVGRLAPIGYVFLYGFLFSWLLDFAMRNRRTVIFWSAIGLFTTAHYLEHYSQLYVNEYDPNFLNPTAAESEYFASITEPVVYFPTNKNHQNTRPMLIFSPFQNIRLMNGYSGRDVPLWVQIMDMGKDREPTHEQLLFSHLQGVRIAILDKSRLNPAQVEAAKGLLPNVFESQTYLALDLSKVPTLAQ